MRLLHRVRLGWQAVETVGAPEHPGSIRRAATGGPERPRSLPPQLAHLRQQDDVTLGRRLSGEDSRSSRLPADVSTKRAQSPVWRSTHSERPSAISVPRCRSTRVRCSAASVATKKRPSASNSCPRLTSSRRTCCSPLATSIASSRDVSSIPESHRVGPSLGTAMTWVRPR